MMSRFWASTRAHPADRRLLHQRRRRGTGTCRRSIMRDVVPGAARRPGSGTRRRPSGAQVVAVLRQVGAERGQRQVLEDEAAQQPGGDLQRQHGEADERDERDQAEAGGREDRRDRRDRRRAAARRRRCRRPRAGCRARSRATPPHAAAHADVLDRDHHLRQQVEEVHERDPDDQRRSRRARSRPSTRAGRRSSRPARSRRRRTRDRPRRSPRRRAAGRRRA